MCTNFVFIKTKQYLTKACLLFQLLVYLYPVYKPVLSDDGHRKQQRLNEMNLLLFTLLLTFAFADADSALDCGWNEWQCGDKCINDHSDCDGTCQPWYMKCKPKSDFYQDYEKPLIGEYSSHQLILKSHFLMFPELISFSSGTLKNPILRTYLKKSFN